MKVALLVVALSSADTAAAGTLDPSTPFWEQLGDDQLTSLVGESFRDNGDLAAAMARVDQSRALAHQARAGLLPAVAFDLAATEAPQSSLTFQQGASGIPLPPADGSYTTTSATLGGQWNLDVFGRQVLTWHAARHDLEARAGDRDAAALALAEAVTVSWLDLASVGERLALAEDQLAATESLLEVVTLRYERGDATALDVLQQRQQLAATTASIPGLRLQQRLAQHQLAVLTGRPATTDVPSPAGLPQIPADMAQTGLSDVPGLRTAAATADAARAQKNAAWRTLLPSVAATGSVGQQGLRLDDWSTQDVWTVGGVVTVPIFNGGLLHAGVAAGRAGEIAAVRSLEQQQLAIAQRLADARVTVEQQRALADAVRAQSEAATLAYETARDQYIAGAAPFVVVVTSFEAMQQAQMAAVSARRDVLVAQLQLHSATGGPWTLDLASRTSP